MIHNVPEPVRGMYAPDQAIDVLHVNNLGIPELTPRQFVLNEVGVTQLLEPGHGRNHCNNNGLKEWGWDISKRSKILQKVSIKNYKLFGSTI